MTADRRKSAFITGGTSGIGLATAVKAAAQGWNVAVVGRRAAPEGLQDNRLIRHFQADVTDEDALRAAFEDTASAFGPIDFIFNNAGAENIGDLIVDQSADAFRKLFELNVLAVYNGMKFGQAHMRDGGAIVNTASIAGVTQLPGYAQYSATKAAVISLTKTAALEFAPRKIRVNAINPGSIWSEMLTPGNPEAAIVEIACPLNRVGEAAEVADLALFLASDAASYINGQAISIDGGVTAGFSFSLLEKIAS